MSDENIIKINENDSQSTILTTINHNFRVLTSRMKELNFSLSYLDVLRISKIHNVNETPGTDAAARGFVSRTWNLLGNYEGAYINGTKDVTLFTWQDDSIKTGDFIIKLPGNNSIHIKAASPRYYYPAAYDELTGTITYNYATTGGSGVITVPTIASAPANIVTFALPATTTTVTGTVTATTEHITHIESYTSSLEPVYNAVTIGTGSLINSSNIPLTVVVSYVNPNPGE